VTTVVNSFIQVENSFTIHFMQRLNDLLDFID